MSGLSEVDGSKDRRVFNGCGSRMQTLLPNSLIPGSGFGRTPSGIGVGGLQQVCTLSGWGASTLSRRSRPSL